MPTEYDRERIETLLNAAKENQRYYWDSLSELEDALNCEIDGETISTHDVESLIAMAEGEDDGADQPAG